MSDFWHRIAPRKILVVKTHAIGDVLMVTPALRAIRKFFPGSEIHFLTGTWSSKVLSENPNIDRIIAFPDEIFFKINFVELFRLVRLLRSTRYDAGFVFQPSQAVHWMVRLGGIPIVAAPLMGINTSRVKFVSKWRSDRDRYVVEDFLDVVRQAGIPSDGVELDFPVPDLVLRRIREEVRSIVHQKHGLAVLCPGGGTNPRDHVGQKIWPAERFAQIAFRLMELDYSVLVSGVESERKGIQPVLDVPGIFDYVGRSNLHDLAAWLTCASICITNDSAPLHVALARGCPAVVVFGPSRPKALLPKSGRVVPVGPDASCAPCYDNEPFPGCSRCDCIQSVTIDKVWAGIMQVFEKWSR